MPVSKRLRFEILRRDNHTCKYCGGTAPAVVLTVDHVVPVALGGTDEPANLVAACKDCNAGKSSVPADAPLIADVAADAMRWAQAMELVAQARAVDRAEAEYRYDKFHTAWKNWTYTNWRGEKFTVDLPGNWRTNIDQFLKAGLELDDLIELIRVAMGSKADDGWRYFCGCCWRRIKDAQEQAAHIVAWSEETGRDIG